MGWFTRSSNSDSSSKVNTSANAETTSTATTSATPANAPQSQTEPSHSSKDMPSTTEPFSPIPIPDDQLPVTPTGASTTTTTTTTSSSSSSSLESGKRAVTVEQRTRNDLYIFDEYKPSEDIMDKYKVGDALNHLFACSSLGSNIRNYYRYGSFRDCSDKYDHLKFCMSLKTKTHQVAQIMIQKREAELRATKAAQPNSEDVWSVRPAPPEDLVELAQNSP
ncbi:hypothetical protein BGW42_006784 [Actinomortierella wolfii]|nr:hypothetical protein BGW42_006784 [Actinomortierella wolfii]